MTTQTDGLPVLAWLQKSLDGMLQKTSVLNTHAVSDLHFAHARYFVSSRSRPVLLYGRD